MFQSNFQNQAMSRIDERIYSSEALGLQRWIGSVSPNSHGGCVIVHDDQIMGRRIEGLPSIREKAHAEVMNKCVNSSCFRNVRSMWTLELGPHGKNSFLVQIFWLKKNIAPMDCLTRDSILGGGRKLKIKSLCEG